MSVNDDRLSELGLTTPQLSKAKAIDACTVPKGEATKTMSNIEKGDLPRVILLSSFKDLTGWKFWQNALDAELLARVSMKRKGKRGRDDVVLVASDQAGQDRGVLDSFRESISNFMGGT